MVMTQSAIGKVVCFMITYLPDLNKDPEPWVDPVFYYPMFLPAEMADGSELFKIEYGHTTRVGLGIQNNVDLFCKLLYN